MYKLFLCLRYLRSRIIAYFAVLSVTLCVALLLIVVSVMNGFLHRVEMAAKGLFGDIVVESPSLAGLGWYDEFIAELPRQVPEVEAACPYILTYGLLRVPGTEYRQTVQVAGIRLPQQARVTDFAKGLFVQRGTDEPTFDPPRELMILGVAKEREATEAILRRAESAKSGPADLLERAWKALQAQQYGQDLLERADKTRARLLQKEREYQKAVEDGADPNAIKAIEREIWDLKQTAIEPPENHIILGLGLPGLSFRTDKGETIRYIVPGRKVSLTLIPLGRQFTTDISPNSRLFTVVDDCKTDVSTIDSGMVYVPFETLQQLNDMSAEFSAEDPNRVVHPARCTMIHVKVRGVNPGDERRLQQVRDKVAAAWADFERRYPDAARYEVTAKTWRERQVHIVSNVERQRTLVVTMFGIISLVSVVLIFVIFYMIVFQKTKDIGVLKAVGASSAGVAEIFLGYGAAVGLVGSALGTVAGAVFVRNINPIQDWLDDKFGWRVWSREWFLFEKIPNDVDWTAAVFIVVFAILAGLVGALIPAIRAARMQPVEALRYE